jgi:hypothetical protein
MSKGHRTQTLHTKTSSPEEETPDDHGKEAPKAGEAEAAYEARRSVWAQLKENMLEAPRVNLAFVTWRVIQIGDALQSQETLEAFDALARVPLPGEARYDAGCVRALPVIGRALWHARSRQLSAAAQTTTTALPNELLNEASKLRERMLKVLEYQCVEEDNPNDPVTADLASIRQVQGPRYLDLATDLSRLAAYYRDPVWLPVLREDKRHFRADDAKAAEALAARILTQLQQRDDTAAHWTLEVYRGWADLQQSWETVRRGASFVFWPRGHERVPPLGALRPAPGRKGAAHDDPIGPPAPIPPA